jgi:mannose-6-phosphate isomerase-like protein (cupin superfamily)
MKVGNLKDMFRGWVVGNFDPSLWKTDDVEVAVKEYKVGDYEEMHYHKIATEITVIGTGKVEMNGVQYNSGDIITIEPGEATDFRVLEDTITTVIKFPCLTDDKYLVE